MRRTLIATVVALPALVAGAFATAEGGGAAAQKAAAAPSTLTICHKTASMSNPWRRMTVSSRAMNNPKSRSGRLLRGHLRHVGDAIVIGSGACPDAEQTPTPTNAPPARLTICHKTGSSTTPYRRITLSSRAIANARSQSGRILRGHMRHAGDLLLPGSNPCPPGTENLPGRVGATLQPVAGASGSGTATFRFQVGLSRLCYTLTVTGVTNVTAAHIHRVDGGAVVVPLTAPTSGSSTGCATIDQALMQEIIRTPAAFYVNVHTVAYPDGQVQGRLSR